MSWYPARDDAPPDFMAELYGEEDGNINDIVEDDMDDIVEEDMDDIVEEYLLDKEEIEPIDTSPPAAPPFSPSRHPSPELSSVRERSRSRSPLQQSGPRIVIFDEAGNQLAAEGELASDPHALYESAERLGVERGNGRGRSLRGRGRGRRGGRVGSRGQGRGRGEHRRRHDWQPGHPLEEIWMTDDDAPLELREMARDVVRRRQTRVEAMEARRRARASENASELNEELDSERDDDDVFYDAIDGRGNSLLEGVDLHFEWSPMDTFRGVEETFVPERTGSVSSYTNPYDAFRSFWDDNILQVKSHFKKE